MSIDQQAENIFKKIQEIQRKCHEIARLAELVRNKEQIGDETIEYSAEDKQKIITAYQKAKAELTQLISELP